MTGLSSLLPHIGYCVKNPWLVCLCPCTHLMKEVYQEWCVKCETFLVCHLINILFCQNISPSISILILLCGVVSPRMSAANNVHMSRGFLVSDYNDFAPLCFFSTASAPNIRSVFWQTLLVINSFRVLDQSSSSHCYDIFPGSPAALCSLSDITISLVTHWPLGVIFRK